MTPSQRTRFYFPAWGDAAKRRGWLMMEGRLLADLAAPLWLAPEHPLTDLLPQIHAHARALAADAGRAPKPDDLRHGCTIALLGRNKSSNSFTNAEVDRHVALFRLLAAPDDLNALRAFLEPEHAQRLRYLRACRLLATDSYILAIARDKFGPPDFEPPFWENLRLPHLSQLLLTLRHRQPTKHQPATPEPEPELYPEMERAGEPF